MSATSAHFPATVHFARTADGRFRAEFQSPPAEAVEGDTLDELMNRVRLVLAPEADEEDRGGPDFDADLERVLTKNDELYRRLAR